MRPVQEEALLHFIKEDVFAVLPTGCGKSLTFQLVPKVCSYLHDCRFSYPKAAIVVVICPLNALIDSHILELKEHGIPAFPLAEDDLPEDDPRNFCNEKRRWSYSTGRRVHRKYKSGAK